MKTKIVEVDWIDSAVQFGWNDKKKCDPKYLKCKTVGFLIDECKESITIAASINVNNCNSPLTIPKVAVLKRRVIGTRVGPG